MSAHLPACPLSAAPRVEARSASSFYASPHACDYAQACADSKWQPFGAVASSLSCSSCAHGTTSCMTVCPCASECDCVRVRARACVRVCAHVCERERVSVCPMHADIYTCTHSPSSILRFSIVGYTPRRENSSLGTGSLYYTKPMVP